MKHLVIIFTMLMAMAACRSDGSAASRLFERENLVAWCIVPFDAQQRSPMERAAMLNDLEISNFAYDYRDEHIPSFEKEIKILEEHQITLSAVWLWVDPRWEEPLNPAGRQIFDILKKTRTRTEIWMGFPDNAFDELSDDESLSMSLEVVGRVLDECGEIGCSLALYNHGGWFGEPANLVRIIEALGPDQVRIVYNFHHAHLQLDQFEANLELMLPYLSTININGMREEGPKIIPLGQGARELEMLRIIQASGYAGPIGIIGHTEGVDIRAVLEGNLEGLEALKKEL